MFKKLFKQPRIKLTLEQEEFNRKCREVYNSGDMEKAYAMALERYWQNQDNLFYKYLYAVMAGDYSFDESIPMEKRQKLLAQCKLLIKEIYLDPDMPRYDAKHVRSIKNEYFFFYQLHEEQYNLGVENVQQGEDRGYYSMCVGAIEMAKKMLKSGKQDEAKSWATKGLDAFHEFERVDPVWYNLNYFGAEALVILGDLEEAVKVYRDMFRKQGQSVDEAALAKFIENAKTLIATGSVNDLSYTRPDEVK